MSDGVTWQLGHLNTRLVQRKSPELFALGPSLQTNETESKTRHGDWLQPCKSAISANLLMDKGVFRVNLIMGMFADPMTTAGICSC